MNRTYKILKPSQIGEKEIESIVKTIGNGAHVMVPRDWANCTVRIILKQKPASKKHARRSPRKSDTTLKSFFELLKLNDSQQITKR